MPLLVFGQPIRAKHRLCWPPPAMEESSYIFLGSQLHISGNLLIGRRLAHSRKQFLPKYQSPSDE